MTAPSASPQPSALRTALEQAAVPTRRDPAPAWLLEDLGVDEPPLTAAPGDEDGAATVMREAGRAGSRVLPIGAGRGLGFGASSTAPDLLLSLEKFAGVVEHSAPDYVATVRAGTRLRDLQEELSAARQWLAVEPPDADEATVGGVIGAAASSLLEASLGTLRAHLLGVRVMHSDGRVSKAGGRVVKNVSGYDLMKLYHGSRGSLVTILDATLRLRPHPPCDRLVVARRTTLSDLAPPHELRDALPADPASFHAHGELGRPGEIEVILRFQGAPAAVGLLCKQAREQLGEHAEVQDVPPPGPGARPPVLDTLATLCSRGDDPSTVHAALHGRPSRIHALHRTLVHWSTHHGVRGRFMVDAGTGRWWLRSSGDGAPSAEAMADLATASGKQDARLVIHAMPRATRGGVRAFEVDPDHAALARRLKQRLDPEGILCAGRLGSGT